MTTTKSPLSGFEERLLTDLKDVVAANAAAREPGPARPARLHPGPIVLRPLQAGLRPGRTRRIAVAFAVSAALAAGLVAGGTVTIGGHPAAPGDTADAATFLRHAAAAAGTRDEPSPGPGQLVWIREDATGRTTLVTRQLAPAQRQVQWFRSDGSSQPYGFTYGCGPLEPGSGIPNLGCYGTVPAHSAPWFMRVMRETAVTAPAAGPHMYPAPWTLPDTPSALYTRLTEEASRGGHYWGTENIDSSWDNNRDDITFQLVTRLLSAPVPAPLRAALYQAAAKIPGVTLIRNAVDAAGRHGVAVARTQDEPRAIGGPQRAEFILDPASYRFLGSTQIAIASGTIVYAEAYLQSGYVPVPRS